MYLVTGATGHVGSEVVAQLLASGQKVRVFTRDVSKVAHWAGRVQVAAGDFRIPETFARASDDVEAIFLMNGNQDPQTFARFVAAANGTPRIVFLSTILADTPQMEVGQLHKHMEDAIRSSRRVHVERVSVGWDHQERVSRLQPDGGGQVRPRCTGGYRGGCRQG